jgi:hypothetical protein
MGSDGFRWVQMGSDGFRWVQMGLDGFRQVQAGSALILIHNEGDLGVQQRLESAPQFLYLPRLFVYSNEAAARGAVRCAYKNAVDTKDGLVKHGPCI